MAGDALLEASVADALDAWINGGRRLVGQPNVVTPIADTTLLRRRREETPGLGLTDRLMKARLKVLHEGLVANLQAGGLAWRAAARPTTSMIGTSKTRGELRIKLTKEYSP